MTTEALPIDRIVRVNASIAPSTPLRPDFGRTLLITEQADLLRPPDNRTASFSDVVGVGKLFRTTGSTYKKAQEYFGQTPYPKDLIIGSWSTTALAAQIVGGTHSLLAGLNAITTGALTISGVATTTINLAGAGTFAAAAVLVETAIQALTNPADWVAATTYTVGNLASGSDSQIYQALVATTGNDPVDDDGSNWELLGPQVDAASVDYDTAGRFVITNVNNLAMILPSGSIATALGWTTSTGGRTFAGFAADASIADAYNEMIRLDGTFYWVGHDSAINDYADDGVLQQLAAAVQSSGRYQLDLNSYGPDPLVTAEATSFYALYKRAGPEPRQRELERQGRREHRHGHRSGYESTVNFNGVDTLVNPHGRPLKGFTPGRLTVAQADELERKRVNYFATIGPQAIYTPGTTFASGVWRDSQYFLDWLQEEVQLRVYNWVVNNPTRNPQTDLGLQGALSVIEQACRQGVRNGGIAQGFVSEALRGSIRRQPGLEDFNGFMEKGFLVYALPFSTVSDVDLRARKAPSPRVWIRGSGAINSIEIDMTFDG